MKMTRVHSGRIITPQQKMIYARHRSYIMMKPAMKPHLPLTERLPAVHIYPSSLLPNQAARKGIDTEVIPNCIMHCSSHNITPHNKKFKETPPLPLITDKEFENVLSMKLGLCNEIFDFMDPDSDVEGKELKEKYLFELIDLLNNDNEIPFINPRIQRAIFYMLEVNIFRDDPIFPTKAKTLDFTMTAKEPSWPHLFYCYQLLNRFITVFPSAEFVNLSVIHKAIFLTQLPDVNERNQLVTFLKIYYDNRPKERKVMINYINDQFQSLIEGCSVPYCGMPLIVLLTHIVSHTPDPLPKIILDVIKLSLIPTIALPYLSLYLINVKQFFSALISTHPDHIVEVLHHMEKVWPITNPSKQLQCLEILLFVFSKMTKPQFKPISHTSFNFLAQFVNSEHTKLSETVLDIWLKQPPEDWIVQNSRVGISEMYESVVTASHSHWCRVNMDKAQQVLLEMAKINKTQFNKMKISFKSKSPPPKKPLQTQAQIPSQNNSQTPPPHIKETKSAMKLNTIATSPPTRKTNPFIKKWTYVTKKATRRGYEGNFDDTIAEITEYFSNEKEQSCCKSITHFTPAVFERMPSKNDHRGLY